MNLENLNIITLVIDDMILVIKDLSSFENKKEQGTKRIVFIDLLYRSYANLKTIKYLLNNYLTDESGDVFLPIGLLMRCCLEDIIYANYLLSFKDYPEIIEKEIIVQSREFIKGYIQFKYDNAHEYWLCSEKEKIDARCNEDAMYNELKKFNPDYYTECEIRSIKNIRGKIPIISEVFDNKDYNTKISPSIHYKRLKEIESDESHSNTKISYIYFLYKLFCQFEHYSKESREYIVMNDHTFAEFCYSIDFILISMIRIFDYLNANNDFKTKLNYAKQNLSGLKL